MIILEQDGVEHSGQNILELQKSLGRAGGRLRVEMIDEQGQTIGDGSGIDGLMKDADDRKVAAAAPTLTRATDDKKITEAAPSLKDGDRVVFKNGGKILAKAFIDRSSSYMQKSILHQRNNHRRLAVITEKIDLMKSQAGI